MSKLILIDGGFVCAQARFATGHLETSDLDSTGVTFGFLSRLLYLCKMTGSKDFIFAWDTKESYRRNVYPEYKRTRTAKLTPEEYAERVEYYKQVDRLREDVLPRLGFKNSFWFPGLEADDVIAQVSLTSKKPCLIVSSDQDMYQLLTDDVSMLVPTTRGRPPKLYTKEDFIIAHKIPPKKWWKAKAIMGCQSDNVAGIRGIGPAYALRYLRDELSPDSKQYQMIKDNWDIVKRNVELVKLPHKKTPKIRLTEDELSYNAFAELCKEYEFESFLRSDNKQEWSELFGDSKKRIRERLNK